MARETALDRAKRELAAEQTRYSSLESVRESVERDFREMRDDRDRWRNAHLEDPEANALAACVRAFDTMREAMRERSTNQSGVYGNTGRAWSSDQIVYGTHEEPRPSALRDPVGRVLLALAARFDLEIEATVPAPRVVEGNRLMSVPAELAEQVERLVGQGPFG